MCYLRKQHAWRSVSIPTAVAHCPGFLQAQWLRSQRAKCEIYCITFGFQLEPAHNFCARMLVNIYICACHTPTIRILFDLVEKQGLSWSDTAINIRQINTRNINPTSDKLHLRPPPSPVALGVCHGVELFRARPIIYRRY